MGQEIVTTVPWPSPTSGVPPSDSIEPSPLASPEIQHDEPLYTEINIPLPPLPKQFANKTSLAPESPKPRSRSHTLHSMLPFHHRRSSSTESEKAVKFKHFPDMDSESSNDTPHTASSIKSIIRGRRRNQTVGAGALAVAPAVLMLRAELFTPGEERDVDLKERKHEGVR
ncbi:hypothetical protein EJ04DRAFT_510320 [Polyplosphaeria fusca]|uniref:Uncharacterized protein n=1 Tax=Polyplosphaeria fusca TaxID=682080 RepID=A0A9P4R648_9PLEO|nr:hypothetical protein EJ04DRAFT_510320 [Polyplosphaeria fusca]